MSCFVIAEIGVNHNGELSLAKEMIAAAQESGANAVKFQSFKASRLATAKLNKADYQKRTTSAGENQFEMLQRLELSDEDHWAIYNECVKRDLPFMSSAFDVADVEYLKQFPMPYLKIPSGELTNAPLLVAAAKTGQRLILSTGMSELQDVETALHFIAFGLLGEGTPTNLTHFYDQSRSSGILRDRVSLLHCLSQYPAPLEEVHLLAIRTMSERFGLSCGYSDHTQGDLVALTAVALGAHIIEKHFTTDCNLSGPDHKASMEPLEFSQMVRKIRDVERALGSADKTVQPSEISNRNLVRRSLVTTAPLRKGESFTEKNLTSKRPGTGLSPSRYWELLDRRALSDLPADHLLTESDVD